MDVRLIALQDAGGNPQPAPQPAPGAAWVQFVPLILIAVIFWFLLIRPQKKKESTRQDMISRLKKNDRVYTSGGIFGTVVGFKDNDVVLRVDDDTNTRLRIMRQSILGLEGQTDGEPAPSEMNKS